MRGGWCISMSRPIRNRGAYLDRTWQEAHRREAGQYAAATDIDLMGYCGLCKMPLYVTEASMTRGRDLSHIRRLADGVGGEALHIHIRPADFNTERRIGELQEQLALVSAELESLTARRDLGAVLLDGTGFELSGRDQVYQHLSHIRRRHDEKHHRMNRRKTR